MNPGQDTGSNQKHTDKQLRGVDDTYIYNSASGLYEPKSYARQDQIDRKAPGTFKNHPLFFNTNRDWVVIVVSVLGLLISGLTLYLLFRTVHYARKQWESLDMQYPELQKSADAATNAVGIARDQVHLDQRAWIAVLGLTGPPSKPILEITNTGKTPAKNVVVYLTLWYSDDFKRRPNFDMLGDPSRLGILSPGAKRGSGFANTVPKAEFMKMYAFGKVTYDDVFGRQHWVTFCNTLDVDRKNYDVCEKHNDAD